MIPTRVHGYIDYAYAVVLILAPFVLGFAEGGAAQWVPTILGIAVFGMALITDYEVSVARIMPMPLHLGLDIVAGLFLALSPWLFGFSGLIWWPHVIFGLVAMVVPALTSRQSNPTRRRSDR